MRRLLQAAVFSVVLIIVPFLMPGYGSARAFCIFCDQIGITEYVNAFTGRYLLLPDYDPETTLVQQGSAGPGWERTGNDFVTITEAAQPVCRFYSPRFNSHFYTADPAECAAVKTNPDWVYEKTPFNVIAASSLGCPGGTYPVARLYLAGDHRYTADREFLKVLQDKGWRYEGVAFCTRQGSRSPLKAFSPPGQIGSPGNGGTGTVADSLAPMLVRIPAYLPPNYFVANPDYPANVNRLTSGRIDQADVWTSQTDPSAVLEHSFATLGGAVYINGHDRIAADYAGISQMQQLPMNPDSAGDNRLFVWNHSSDRELRINGGASVGIVAKDGPGSHAYGHPLLQFADARSRHTFTITIQAYGTVPPGDFVGRDVKTGEIILSTVFRPDPRFGRVLSGTFTACNGDGAVQCMPVGQNFSFSLKRADFQAALDLARAVDPALSGDPADYFVTRYAFHNETYLDARLGANTGIGLQVWYVE